MMNSVDDFNSQVKIGDAVIYVDDFGKKESTNTRSIAWKACGSGLVLLDGKSGGYDIERVWPVIESP